ncbi:methyl-accepting chemotaxis sensory transducer with Cache sensor [Tamilnaduibacter salinus]|uniref:Methyl-accepting chemotaxis sensory transducer with Cache sensor n=1 Tax=Tamilnaduibacter salinus TaxID=1484056 RepID=A0A2U1CY23_9GAMM|nr:methyl-accepting chemotaxis protein [Tamilnaduibacter salinus]PVY77398.1 methyl-accepting chemotaxis sensory transducer with Cache sensor [Tamilnaduibacter salinus]
MTFTKKLVLTFVAILVVVIVSLSLIAIQQARQTAEHNSEQASLRQIEQIEYSVAQFFGAMKAEAQFLASHRELAEAVGRLTTYLDPSQGGQMTPLKNSPTEASLFRLFESFADAKGGLRYVYYGTEEGEFVQWPLGESGAPYDPRERPWYNAALQAGEGGAITDAYYFETDDASIISVTHEVRDQRGNTAGAVGIDVSLEGLTAMIRDVEIGDSGKLLLIEDTGTILANPLAPETNFQSVDELETDILASLQSQGEGNQTIEYAGTTYEATVFTSPELGWTFIGLVPRDKMMASATDLGWTIAIVGLLFLALAIGVAVVLGRMLTRPLRTVSDKMRDIAAGEGDLTQRLPEQGTDEIGDLSRQFNAFVERMHQTIQDVDGTTQSLASAAEQLNQVASETRQSVERQSSQTDQIATAINEMTATVQEVSQNATSVADAASDADTKAREGGTVVGDNSRAMETLIGELDDMATVIGQLAQRSQEIKTVLDVIHSVTEQTNLLALNAAIEAARAGEQGRGFAVVADEVRSLAQRSNKSADEIQTIIDGLITETDRAVHSMEQAKERSGESQQRASKASEALTDIESSVSTIHEQVTQIATAAEEQSQAAEEINQNVTGIVEAAQHSSSGTEQTNSASDEVARMAERLRDVVGRFRI